MKKTIFFSVLLALAMNLWQFASSYQQREAAASPIIWKPAAVASNSQAAQAARAAVQPTPMPTGSTATPATPDPAAKIAERLVRAGMKPDYAALYLAAQNTTGTPWQLLAAVHKAETGQRGSTPVASYAGAIGPMQFMPATFRAYGRDGNGDGVPVITNLEDSVMSAGTYLAANGAARGNYHKALYQYNHSNRYVSQVLSSARKLGL